MSHDVFHFVFITDTQIGMNSPAGLHGAGSDKERLDSAIAWINNGLQTEHLNEHEIDFVVFGGDQINNPGDEKTAAQLDAFKASLSSLTVPYFGVVGNHDQEHPDKDWQYKERRLPVRFSMTLKNTFLVGINASWIRGDFGDRYRQEEWEHLEAELARVPTSIGHRFVVMHWPLFIFHPREDETYWNMPNRGELVDLFKKHGVSCVLTGHWHADIDACWHGIPLSRASGLPSLFNTRKSCHSRSSRFSKPAGPCAEYQPRSIGYHGSGDLSRTSATPGPDHRLSGLRLRPTRTPQAMIDSEAGVGMTWTWVVNVYGRPTTPLL
jgi:3',5'-cyclic AMP phosphodiesterase CpdA